MTIDYGIDPAMVEEYILTLAAHGKHGETGVWRPVYSDAWFGAQRQLEQWMNEAGLTVWWDAAGNVWGRLEGSEPGGAIVSGSHIDSQLPGGRYDGALGVLSALIAVRRLSEQFGQPRKTIDVVSFCEEESSRFPQTRHWGSRAVAGEITSEDMQTILSYDGEPIGQVMREVGFDPDKIGDAKRDDIDIYVELHIEQGPILEQQNVPVAIVDGITGIRHYHITLVGRADHAGARPMDTRRDPMAGAAEMITNAINTAHRMGRPAVTTSGKMDVEPNAPAIVPERVTFTIDARHPDPFQREMLYQRHEAMFLEVADRRDLEISWTIGAEHNPTPSDPELVKLFQEAASEQALPFITMASGAVHDANRMAHYARMVMLFVQSKDGRSHTPDEFTSVADATAGIRLLAAGLHKLAY